MEDFGDPSTGEGEQADRDDRPGVCVLVPVESGAEATELVPVEVPRDRLGRIPDDVGAGVRDVLSAFTPMLGRTQHGAKNPNSPDGGPDAADPATRGPAASTSSSGGRPTP